MGAHRQRLLRPINALSASKLLLQKQLPDQLPTPLSNACRAIRIPVDTCKIDVADSAATRDEPETVETLPAAEMPMRLASGARRPH